MKYDPRYVGWSLHLKLWSRKLSLIADFNGTELQKWIYCTVKYVTWFYQSGLWHKARNVDKKWVEICQWCSLLSCLSSCPCYIYTDISLFDPITCWSVCFNNQVTLVLMRAWIFIIGCSLDSRMTCFHTGFLGSKVADVANVGTANSSTDGATGCSWVMWVAGEVVFSLHCMLRASIQEPVCSSFMNLSSQYTT